MAQASADLNYFKINIRIQTTLILTAQKMQSYDEQRRKIATIILRGRRTKKINATRSATIFRYLPLASSPAALFERLLMFV